MALTLDNLFRASLLLLALVLIMLQFATWRATLAVSERIELTRSTIGHVSCGDINHPCRVIVVTK